MTPELGLEAQLHRPLDVGPGLYRFGVGLYNWIQWRAPRLHHIYFNFLEIAAPCRSTSRLLGAKQFCETLKALRPEVLLSVHGSLNHGYFDCARNFLGRENVRCITYCGELFGGYGFSRNWVNPGADLFIGAVQETCDAAIGLRMLEKKVRCGGFLLRPQFYEPPPDTNTRHVYIRNELGFNPDEFILLLSASSRGANNHIAFLEALKRNRVDVQIALLCGKSAEAEMQVSRWLKENPRVRGIIVQHNANVARLLHCVSAVVARPGTGATSEAIISQCPLLLNCLDGAMPQEWITVKYCRKHQLAETVHHPHDLSRLVAEWLKHPSQREAIQDRMRKVRPTEHPRDILRIVAGLA